MTDPNRPRPGNTEPVNSAPYSQPQQSYSAPIPELSEHTHPQAMHVPLTPYVPAPQPYDTNYGMPIQGVAMQTRPHHGLAIAGFVCALVGVLFGLIPLTFFMAFILGALGLTFGLVGRKHTLGKWAVALAIVAVALGIYGVIVVNRAVNNVNNDFNSYTQCVQNATTIEEQDAC